MPNFASLVQQHIGHTSKAPWKAQAEMFLGLLQSMGGQVPESKRAETTGYVNQIIDLLTTSKNDIYTDAQTTKDTTQDQLNQGYADLDTEETAANTGLETTRAVDSDLADCYAHLRDIAANHSHHCGIVEDDILPPACVRKNNTKMHTFDVASKDTWACNFTAGQDPTKCTNDASALKQDLVSKREALRLAYQTWRMENTTCNNALAAEHELCQNTNNSYWAKQAYCQEMFINASDHLCNFREKISQWKHYLETLETTQTRAATLLEPKEREWKDLNLIICMLKKFRDRQPKMTFSESDYSECEAESQGLVWVGVLDLKTSETETLKAGSLYNHECLDFSFTGGLAEKHRAQLPPTTVTYDTEAEVSFSFNTDGSSGCTSTTTEKTKVCQAGFRVA